MRLNEARLLMKQKNIGTQPGELLWSETERADFKQRLASIESSTDMSQSTLRQLVALISDMKKRLPILKTTSIIFYVLAPPVVI